jgi:hypothetical protein
MLPASAVFVSTKGHESKLAKAITVGYDNLVRYHFGVLQMGDEVFEFYGTILGVQCNDQRIASSTFKKQNAVLFATSIQPSGSSTLPRPVVPIYIKRSG